MPARHVPPPLSGVPPESRIAAEINGRIPKPIKTGTYEEWSTTQPAAKKVTVNLLEAIRAALTEFRRPEKWAVRMERAMSKDFSWDVSARECSNLYRRLVENG